MKRILIFLLLFAAIKVAGQTTGYLRFDTVKIMKQNGTCELYIINKTKDTLGLLTNIGGGLTQFIKSRSLNDSTLIVGLDTLHIRGGTGTSIDTTIVNQLISDSIAAHPTLIFDTTNYLAGSTVDTITLTALVAKTPMLIVSNPYTLHIATSYPPASDEVWVNTSTGGLKFGTSLNSGQTITALYKYYAVTPFSSVITDLEYIVAASGGTINNGDVTFTIPSLVNKRIRFYRNQLLQPSTNYSLNSSIGQFTLTAGAAVTGELFQFQTY